MKHLLHITAFVMLGGIFLLAAGCSDDGPTNPATPGDPNDPNFQYVDTAVFGDGFTQGFENMMEFTFILMDSIPGVNVRTLPHHNASTAAFNSVVFDSLSYQWTGQWHVFYFQAWAVTSNPTDTIDFVGTDSVHFTSSGTPQQYPDSTTDGFGYRAHATMNTRVATFDRNADHSIDISVDNLDLATATINGSAVEALAFTYSDTAATCDVDVNSSFNANNVVMNLNTGDCPQSGSMTATASLSMTCSGSLTLSVDGTWSASMLFNDPEITFTLTDGTNYWTMTDTCGTSGPVAAHMWR